jgi:hypothetical protein
MSYKKKTWVDNEIITDVDLNNIEDGIKNLENESNNWQKYKLTNDNGYSNFLVTDNLDMMDLDPGEYGCFASRFKNPPIPGNEGYIEVSVRADTNSSGIRKTYLVY